jgi:putative flavoprotein involved in K+ transport
VTTSGGAKEQSIVLGGGPQDIAAHALVVRRHRPLLLESRFGAVGSWPGHCESPRLFTLSWFNALPFPGDPHRYPSRTEATEYLRGCVGRRDCEVGTYQRITSVTRDDGVFHSGRGTATN